MARRASPSGSAAKRRVPYKRGPARSSSSVNSLKTPNLWRKRVLMSMRNRLRRMGLGLGLGLALALTLSPVAAFAETCSVESFGEAVDTSAAELRKFSADTQPQLKQKLQALRAHNQWDETDFEARGLALVHDKKLDAFDAQAGELLSKIDTLGSPEASDPTANLSCANLSELKAASSELMSVMRAKSAYLISKIDREIASTPAAKPTEVAKVETTAPAEPPPPRSYSSPANESMVIPNEDALSPLRRADPQKKPEPPKTVATPVSKRSDANSSGAASHCSLVRCARRTEPDRD